MKKNLFILISTACLLLVGCKRSVSSFLNDKDKMMAIQPIGDFDPAMAVYLQKELEGFYHKKVLLLQQVPMPAHALSNLISDFCSADSIVSFLSTLVNDSISAIVGLTHYDLYTIKKTDTRIPLIKEIFGMGNIPGNSCILSNRRLYRGDSLLAAGRLKKVAIHEIGHNLNLAHCVDANCIMSEANGEMNALDKSKAQYCEACRRKIE